MILDSIFITFNNREVALITYLLICILWVLTQKQIRKSLFNVIKVLTSKFMLISIAALLVYITVLVWCLYLLRFWELTMLKDTIYWTFGVGFTLMMKSDKAIKEDHYFKKVILDNLKIAIVIEFVINLYVFGLVTEFILMPIVILFSMMLGYAEVYKEYSQVKRLILAIFSIAGLCYLVYSGFMIYNNFKEFSSFYTLKSFLLPILLVYLFLPFAYLFALYMHYESLFTRIKFSLKEQINLSKYARKRILIDVNLSLTKLKKITPGFLFSQCNTKEDIRNEIRTKLG